MLDFSTAASFTFLYFEIADVSGLCFGSNSLQLTGKLVDKVVAVR